MITHSDEGPDPEDPLTVLLRPSAEYLGAPPGHYEAIRRGAARRKLLRAAAGTALTCAAVALAVLPLRLSGSDAPRSPTVPMAPPPMSSPAPTPTPSDPVTPEASPTQGAPSSAPSTAPSTAPSETVRPSASGVPTSVPTADRTPTEETATRASRP